MSTMLRWTPEQLAAHQQRTQTKRAAIIARNSAPAPKLSEHDHQAKFFEWAAKQSIPGLDLLHATPNGGLRSKAQAGKLKAEGVKPGHPDVSWPVARGGFIGLAIEFKAGDGNPTKEQRERIDALQREGWCVAVCWSWQAAARMVQGYAQMARLAPIEDVPEPEPEPDAKPEQYRLADVRGFMVESVTGDITVDFRDGSRVTLTQRELRDHHPAGRQVVAMLAVRKANTQGVQQ